MPSLSRRSRLLAIAAICGTCLFQLKRVYVNTAGAYTNLAQAFDAPSREQLGRATLSHGSGRFAYVFVVSGCTLTSCEGYILNAIVNARVLKDFYSVADIVCKVQMSSNRTRLPSNQEMWLQKSNVKLEYLPPSHTGSFGVATLHKFRVLDMLQYDRVLFLDSDVILLGSMDYMFRFEGHVAVAGAVAPATASIFLVVPTAGEYRRIIDIVRLHRNRARNPNAFNRTLGWGQPFVPPDSWESWGKRKGGQFWDFYAASADQGLLYHWLKYEQMNYTQIHINRIETWEDVSKRMYTGYETVFHLENGKKLAKTQERAIEELDDCGDAQRFSRGHQATHPPWRDHFHFSGKKKPWNLPIRADDAPLDVMSVSAKDHMWGRSLWLFYLVKANHTFDLNLPTEIDTNKGNPLGYKSKDEDLLHPNVVLPV